MIRRHPHVFDPENNEKSYSWDELKAQEKKNIQKSVLDGVSKSLPALVAAYKLQEKAAKLGLTGMSSIRFGRKFRKKWMNLRRLLPKR